MKAKLTIAELPLAAERFCKVCSQENHPSLFGVTDGKTIGTYVEHKFQKFLLKRYDLVVGNSASGIDLPGDDIQTDIKVTSGLQPQSSCPFKDAQQKIFGLGYNLLVFVYEKRDTADTCKLRFTHCTFIDKERTADFKTTKRLREMLKDGAEKEDIVGYLEDMGLPGDEIVHDSIAEEILRRKPKQGYLTISNALQWRLQYKKVIALDNKVLGVKNYVW